MDIASARLPLNEAWPRSGILKRLESGSKLVLLVAGPGFGKTRAVEAWLSAQGLPVVWFRPCIARLASSVDGPLAIEATVLRQPGGPREGLADPLAAAPSLMSQLGPAGIAVFDGYEGSDSPELAAWLEDLVIHLPLGWRAVVTSRRLPPLRLARLGLPHIDLLGEDDLALDRDELSRLAPNRSADEYDLLHKWTEGWPMAVFLCHALGWPLGSTGETSWREAIAGYLKGEVLSQYPPEVSQALLVTSFARGVPERELITALGDGLLGHGLGRAVSDRLLASDPGGPRSHRMLQEVIRHNVQPSIEAAQALVRVGRAMWRMGDFAAAAAALAAGDPAELTGRIEEAGPDLLRQGNPAQLCDLLSRVPESLVTPRLLCLGGEGQRQLGDLPQAKHAFAEALRGFTAASDDRGEAEARAGLAAVAGQQGRLSEQGDLIARALSSLVGPSPARAFALNVLGNHLLTGRTEPARAAGAFAEALALYRDAGDVLGQARVMHNLAVLQTRHGRLRQALDAYEGVLRLLEGRSSPPFVWITRANRSILLSSLGDAQAGRTVAQELLANLDYIDLPFARAEAWRCLAFALARTTTPNTREPAEHALEEALKLEQGRKNDAGIQLTWHFRSDLLLRFGDLHEALAAAGRAWPLASTDVEPATIAFAQVRAKILVGLGRIEEAGDLLRAILELSRAQDYAHHLYEALVTEMRRRRVQGDEPGASAIESEASSLASRWGYDSDVPTIEGAARPDFNIRLFGPFEVLREGRPIATSAWRSARARKLLAYFLEYPAGTTKGDLLEILYPEGSSDGAVAVAVARLRSALESPDAVRFEDQRYRWDPLASVEVDTRKFKKAIGARRWQEALDLYKGPFLPEFEDAWVQAIRQRYLNDALAAITSVIAQARDSADWDGVVAAAHQGLVWEPCAEELHETLIEAYSLLDRPQLAFEQYQLCRRVFAQRLGTEPSPSLLKTLRRLQPG